MALGFGHVRAGRAWGAILPALLIGAIGPIPACRVRHAVGPGALAGAWAGVAFAGLWRALALRLTGPARSGGSVGPTTVALPGAGLRARATGRPVGSGCPRRAVEWRAAWAGAGVGAGVNGLACVGVGVGAWGSVSPCAGCGRCGRCGGLRPCSGMGLPVGLALCVALGLAAGVDDGAAPFQFSGGGHTVFFGHFAGGLAVEVEAVRRVEQGLDVGRAGGVAVQEDRQRLAAEDTRGALLNVDLHTQLDGQRAARPEQGRKVLRQLCGAGGGRQVGRLRELGLAWGAGAVRGLGGCSGCSDFSSIDSICGFYGTCSIYRFCNFCSLCGHSGFSRFSRFRGIDPVVGVGRSGFSGLGGISGGAIGQWRLCAFARRGRCRGCVGWGAGHGVDTSLVHRGRHGVRRRVGRRHCQGLCGGLVVGGGQGSFLHALGSGAAKCRRRLSTLAGVAVVRAVNVPA